MRQLCNDRAGPPASVILVRSREAARDTRSYLLSSVSSASSAPSTASAPSAAAAPSSSSAPSLASAPSAARRWLLLALVALGIAVVPLSLGPLNRAAVGNLPPLGYLPSLEIRRPHQPFRVESIEELRFGNPRWVFIGDSMLGTRIDPFYLGRISTGRRSRSSFLYHAATGPAWWYLAFKNQLVASGVKPRMTFIFFRDTNLTDTMFRLEGQYGRALDEVAARVRAGAGPTGRGPPKGRRGIASTAWSTRSTRPTSRPRGWSRASGGGGCAGGTRARTLWRASSGTSTRRSRSTRSATTSAPTWRSRR